MRLCDVQEPQQRDAVQKREQTVAVNIRLREQSVCQRERVVLGNQTVQVYRIRDVKRAVFVQIARRRCCAAACGGARCRFGGLGRGRARLTGSGCRALGGGCFDFRKRR